MPKAPDSAVVLSSRVRLARNFSDLPFPSRMNEEAARMSVERTEQALSGSGYTLYKMADLDAPHRQAMVENHLISKETAADRKGSAVLVSPDKEVSVMVNEEDHLRIQTLLPGGQLEKAADLARQVDEGLEKNVQYAFDEQLGYLTCCPTNTGSGMRASQMLHLPALTLAGQMPSITQQIGKLGLTIRGLYGEGSEAQGNLYQVSNQVTLGRTEREIVDTITALGNQLIEYEMKQRELLSNRDIVGLTDRVMRSYGVLRHAYRLDSAEFMQRWSDVRLAVMMDLLQGDLAELDALLIQCQPATILIHAGREMSTVERDELRASLVRETLRRISEPH